MAWAATAVGSLGLVGLAAAQQSPQGALDIASADAMMMDALAPKAVPLIRDERMEGGAPISDDGWSTEVPITRQIVVARQRVGEPLSIDLFNESGEVLEHVEWSDHDGRFKPLALDPLVAGRYAVRVTGAGRSQVIRFRRD